MKVVDLFCGCGGLSLGFENAGYDVVAAFDNWEKAIDIYKENFDHPIHNVDLSNVEETVSQISAFSPDIIIGGPPCQDFSSAGKRDVTMGRADLTYSYANIIAKEKPTWFVMENVDRIRKSHILHEIIQQLNEVGYGMSAVILNASLCNVPQARNRFFLVGNLGGVNNALLAPFQEGLDSQPMTMRDYFGDSLKLDYYYRHPRNYSRRGVFSMDEPSPTVRGVNRPVPKGYSKHKGDPVDVHNDNIRPLTTKERSMIQTFPESFYLEGAKTHLEQMVGNAVPVNLGKYVADTILKYKANEEYYKGLIEPQYNSLGELLNEDVIIPERHLR